MPDSIVMFEQQAANYLADKIQSYRKKKSSVFILTDTNTHLQCLPLFFHEILLQNDQIVEIEVKAGEENKTLESAQHIWSVLTKHQAGRDTLLMNLGGGAITDLGCFAASCYKRGISCINIPTTLMGMVDAAIGGKTGINFSDFKNQIGTFHLPEKVLIFTKFLKTLPPEEMRSAKAEILKYGFITSPHFLNRDFLTQPTDSELLQIVKECAEIKVKITQSDPHERGIRKILNFGHTVGHAFESFALENGLKLSHGKAIAAGMVAELYLSYRRHSLDKKVLDDYVDLWHSYFTPFFFNKLHIDDIVGRMAQDKKNKGGELHFVLISEAGKADYDCIVERNLVKESLEFYLNQIGDEPCCQEKSR